MAGPRYEVDAEGNLVEPGRDAEGKPRTTRAGIARLTRLIVCADVVMLLALLGAAALTPQSRTALLIGAGVYALAAPIALLVLRRAMFARLDEPGGGLR